MKILVTGIFGFIGSHFVRSLQGKDVQVIGVGRLSNQNAFAMSAVERPAEVKILYRDIALDCSGLLEGIDVVVNFAAKTFVDHSIKDPLPFIQSNIIGTYNLLEQARKYKPSLFVQVSTDEVYGSIAEGAYKEDARLNPTNPYAATKAAADMLVVSYGNTYGLPYIITRTENNYGHYQHPQKVFPTFVKKALAGEKLPVYGDGKHRRMWLRVEDHCAAIWHLIERFKPRQLTVLKHVNEGIYHVAGEQELENLELAKRILKILGKPLDQIEFIPDHDIRPGHDRRYALDVTKLKATGWKPKWTLDDGIEDAVKWYADNQWWLK